MKNEEIDLSKPPHLSCLLRFVSHVCEPLAGLNLMVESLIETNFFFDIAKTDFKKGISFQF